MGDEVFLDDFKLKLYRNKVFERIVINGCHYGSLKYKAKCFGPDTVLSAYLKHYKKCTSRTLLRKTQRGCGHWFRFT